MITPIAHLFPKLRSPKNVVKKISKNSPFRGPLEKQLANEHQALFQPERHHLYHIY